MGAVPAGRGELDRLLEVVDEWQPVEVIVGHPVSLSGGEGPVAAAVRAKARALAVALAGRAVPVRLVDERLSTVTAAQRLRESGRPARRQRAVIDAQAAATILEHALAALRSGNVGFGELLSHEPEPDQNG